MSVENKRAELACDLEGCAMRDDSVEIDSIGDPKLPDEWVSGWLIGTVGGERFSFDGHYCCPEHAAEAILVASNKHVGRAIDPASVPAPEPEAI